MLFRDVTIGKKLYASFTFVLLMMLLVTAFSFFVIGKLEQFRRDVKNVTAAYDEIWVKKDLQLQVANFRRLITDASLTKDRKVIEEEAKSSLDSALKDIERLMELNRNNSDQTTKLEEMKKDLAAMWDTGNRMLSAYLENWAKGNVFMGDYDRMSAKLIKDIAALSDEQAAHAKKDVNAIHKNGGRVLHLISIMIIVLAILGTFFAIFIIMLRNSIVKPLNELSDKVKHITNGDLNIRMNNDYQDEIGVLTRNIDNMLDRIQKHNK